MMTNNSNIEVALVVEVNGIRCKAITFDDMNQATYINNGEVIKNLSVNSFVVIRQNFIKIIGRINSESIWDTQNNKQNYQLDNRFSKNTIKRILDIQIIGYISEGCFTTGTTYIPMIGNICSIPTTEETQTIYVNSFDHFNGDQTIKIGKSLNEQIEVNLPISSFFASHIGIFGNTGSGKSNTLHKLYFELFKQSFPLLREKSRFVVIDFNGEYVHDNSFGVPKSEKNIYELSTRTVSNKRLQIKRDIFFSSEILSILFSATQQTQKPFLERVLKGINKFGFGEESLQRWISSILREIFTTFPNMDLKNRFVSILGEFYDSSEALEPIKQAQIYSKDDPAKFIVNGTFFDGNWESKHMQAVNLEQVENVILTEKLNIFKEFELRCKLQLVKDLLYRNVISDHIDPLLKRIDSRIEDFQKYIEIVGQIDNVKLLEIISLRDLNQEAKQIVAMLTSKMFFDEQKTSKDKVSFHLIIDEAHNILSDQSRNDNTSWKDYRLSTFEEIIKEGRKFGFFLTLSSQRPADISPTLLSQVHNFFLHKLVNERDLQIIDNSLSTLDRVSKSMLPGLSQGICIITGTALSLPMIVNVDFISDKTLRPQSDTVDLVEAWVNE